MWGCRSQRSTLYVLFIPTSLRQSACPALARLTAEQPPFSTLSSTAREFSPVLPCPGLGSWGSELSSSYSYPSTPSPRFLFYVFFCLILSWLNYNSYPNKWGRYLWQICRAQKVCKPSGVMAGAEPGYPCPGCLCSSWRCPFATRPFNVHLKLKDQNLCFHPIEHIAVGPFYQTWENNWKLNNN